jgi:Flp pilus assembly pilin Flp
VEGRCDGSSPQSHFSVRRRFGPPARKKAEPPAERKIAGYGTNGQGGIMQRFTRRLWQDEKGQDLTEYALLLVLISLVATASISTIGQTVSDVFANAAANVAT